MQCDLGFIGLNACIIISLAIASILHAILSAWGSDSTTKRREPH